MNRVIVTCADAKDRGRAAVDRATREASLRGLPLEVVSGSPPGDLSAAAMLALGLSTAEDDTAGPAQLALVAASACPVVLVPDDLTALTVPVRRPGMCGARRALLGTTLPRRRVALRRSRGGPRHRGGP
ncbi:hypothetical protein ACFCYB_37285 [Streptomyces sp. NPDC056309]|uniref:hypothetical protein n=1 Tax=unclassified Streptomyces TaxID=2593676 RepID=UPI0035DCFBFF